MPCSRPVVVSYTRGSPLASLIIFTRSLPVTILWLRCLTVGLIDCHVIRKARVVGSTPDEGHCTVLRAQPLLRCVNIWTVYLSPSRLLIAYSFAYVCLLMAYSFAYLCLRIAYWFLPSR